jgi:thioredoxin 1
MIVLKQREKPLSRSSSMTTGQPITTAAADFETNVLASQTPVLVDFWAAWCGPCQTMGPVVDELAHELEGKARIAKVDVEEHGELAERFGVHSIPTFILFRDGEELERVTGMVPKSTLKSKLEALVAPAA